MKCPCCGGNYWAVLFKSRDRRGGTTDEFEVLRCSACGLAKSNLDGNCRAFWAGRSEATCSADSLVAYKARRVLSRRKEGRLLDIGCGGGYFLAAMKAQGWMVKGVEPDPSLSRYANTILKVDVCALSLQSFEDAPSSYDVITMWHSLEHVAEPQMALYRAYELLAHDGLLFVSVPNLDSFQAKLFKGKWFHLDVPRHIWHFNPSTIRRFLENANFDLHELNFFVPRHNSWGWMKSIAWVLNLNKKGLLNYAFSAFLLGPSFLAASLENLCGRGGTLEVIASKRPL